MLGCDPGRQSGAAVLLSASNEVMAWWSWALMSRKAGDVWRVTCFDPHGSCTVDAMWEVGNAIGRMWTALDQPGSEVRHAATLVVEGLFVPRIKRGQRPVSPQSVIPLAEATGELIGGLRMTPSLRPLANEWRPDQLGIPPRTPADAAEAIARDMAERPARQGGFTWPSEARPGTKAELGALAEAAWIARFGWVRLAGRAASTAALT